MPGLEITDVQVREVSPERDVDPAEAARRDMDAALAGVRKELDAALNILAMH